MGSLGKAIKAFYWLIIILLFVVLAYSTLELILLVGRTMANRTAIFNFSDSAVDLENLFIQHVQGFIAGVLLITIILELIQSFFVFVKSEHQSKYLVILYEIAMIAIVRHLFALDFEHINGSKLFGLSALILVLGILNLLNRPAILKRLGGGLKNSEKSQ